MTYFYTYLGCTPYMDFKQFNRYSSTLFKDIEKAINIECSEINCYEKLASMVPNQAEQKQIWKLAMMK